MRIETIEIATTLPRGCSLRALIGENADPVAAIFTKSSCEKVERIGWVENPADANSPGMKFIRWELTKESTLFAGEGLYYVKFLTAVSEVGGFMGDEAAEEIRQWLLQRERTMPIIYGWATKMMKCFKMIAEMRRQYEGEWETFLDKTLSLLPKKEGEGTGD